MNESECLARVIEKLINSIDSPRADLVKNASIIFLCLFGLVFTNSNLAELTNPVPTGVVSNDSGIAVKCNPVSSRKPL